MSASDFNALYSWDQGYEQAPWIAEFHGCGDREGHFSGNGLRFNTSEDAQAYAEDLASRWFGQDAHRVRDITKPPNWTILYNRWFKGTLQVDEKGIPIRNFEFYDKYEPALAQFNKLKLNELLSPTLRPYNHIDHICWADQGYKML